MDDLVSEVARLLIEHHHRDLPPDYQLLSPAAEVARLLRDHAQEKEQLKAVEASRQKEIDQIFADLVTVAYLLDSAVKRFEKPLEETGQKRIFRELRVLKDQLVDGLRKAGYNWYDPMGQPFGDELAGLLNVDGWRYGPDYTQPCVAQVRNPVILRGETPIRDGDVVVGAPDETGEESTAGGSTGAVENAGTTTLDTTAADPGAPAPGVQDDDLTETA